MTKYNPLLSPIDYTTTLAERYKRQDAQLERYHNQLRERDKQLEAKARAEDPVKMIEQIAQTVGAVKRATTPSAAKKQEIEQKVRQHITSSNLTHEDFVNLRLGENALDADGKSLKPVIQAIREKNADAAKYIESLSGKQLYYAKKIFATKRSAELPALFEKAINFKPEDGSENQLQKDFRRLGTDLEAQKRFKYEWAMEQFGPELLDGKLLFQAAGSNLHNWLDSTEKTARHAIKELVYNQNNKENIETIKALSSNGDAYGLQTMLYNGFTDSIVETEAALNGNGIKQVGDGIEVNGIPVPNIDYRVEFKDAKDKKSYITNIAREIEAQKLINLGYDGGFTTTDRILANQNSEVFKAYGGTSKGNNNLQSIFTEDQWDRIVDASDSGTALLERIASEQQKAQLSATFNKAQIKYSNPENRGGNNEVTLQKTIDYLRSKGDKTSADKLETIQKEDHSPQSYHEQRQEWEVEIEKGMINTKMADIEKITSVKLRNELIELKTNTDNALKSFGGKEKFSSIMDNDIKALIQGDGKTLLNPTTGQLKGNAQYIYDDFENLSKELLALGVKQGLTGDGLKGFIKQKLQEEWEAGGGNLKPSNKNKGRYARSTKRDNPFKNYTAWVKQRELDSFNAQRGLNDTTKQEWDGDMNKSYSLVEDWNDSKFVEKLISQPESVISKEDIRGMIENGYYSAELKYKARKLGIPYGTLFEAQVQALQKAAAEVDPETKGLANPELAEDIARFNIDDIKFLDLEAEVYKGITDLDALALIKRQGIENLSLPQLQRISLAFEGQRRATVVPEGLPLEVGDTFESGKIDPNIIATESEAETVKQEKLEQKRLRTAIEALKALKNK